VDDDAFTRNFLAQYLRQQGLAVTGVADGSEALSCIEKGGFDLVLLDILMEGLSGLEILSTVRQRYSRTDLPVIMATSKDQSQDVVDALSRGANDYVTKPFDFPVVLARVQTQLELKRSVDQIRRLERGLEQKNAELEAANRRMKRDLDAAARVQAALLPRLSPALPSARFAWEFKPCTELAGDLLNILPVDGQCVALYVLDVVGHGVAAALLAVMVDRVLAQLHLTGERFEPAAVAAHLNHEFAWVRRTHQFFTLLYGILELTSGVFRFVAAGHPGPAYLPCDAGPQNLKLPACPIGVGDEKYEVHSLQLRPGDRLFLYSDGITDAFHEDRGYFGYNRLLDLIERGRTALLPEGLGMLLRAAQDWCGDVPPDDDISLLAVELT
jgi:sigma-B regulation protein RsbU (phosphoserine phosphatase)